jgi:enterochelin esterase-like enzyme
MRNRFLFGLAVLALSAPFLLAASGDRGRVEEGLRFESPLLGRAVGYAVYLPPGYEEGSRRYPVVYLLHGYTDSEFAWVQFGEVDRLAGEAIARGEIPAMIIVMPDAGVTWYINDAAGKVPYEDMFVREFIPHIDATYRTRADREFRGVAGLSMGGWGALLYAMRHPDVFSACAAFSAAVWTDEDFMAFDPKRYDELFGDLFGRGLTGRARLTDHFRSHNPLDLAGTLPVESLKKARFYLDCGDDDFLFRGNAALHSLLLERKVPNEMRVRDGGHSWPYWRSGLVDGLKFIGGGFHREAD